MLTPTELPPSSEGGPLSCGASVAEEPASRQNPNRGAASLVSLELMVRLPGTPMDIRVFTTPGRAEAWLRAIETGSTVGACSDDRPVVGDRVQLGGGR